MGEISVVVAMPTTGAVKARTAISLYQLGTRLAERGIKSSISNVDGWNVVDARDLLAASFLKGDATHILFCDSDMDFAPDAAITLIEAKQPFIGAAYAHRFLDLERMRSLVTEGKNFDTAFAHAHKFNILRPRQADNGLLEVDGLGAGFLLVERSVFERMSSELKLRRYSHHGTLLKGFFEQVAVNGVSLSEDLSFCQRWRSIGGRIFVCPTLDVRHIGEMSFGFPFAKLMPAQDQSTSVAPAAITT